MHRRLTITLPEEPIGLIDWIAKTGGRSRFIDEAVREFVKRRHKASLRKQLEEGARHMADRDLAMAEEWALLEEEAWQRHRR